MKASRITVEAKIYEIISILASYLKENRLNEENARSINETDLQALDELTHYMDEHYSFNITLQTLSTIACMSESKMKKSYLSQFIICPLPNTFRGKGSLQPSTCLFRPASPLRKFQELLDTQPQ